MFVSSKAADFFSPRSKKISASYATVNARRKDAKGEAESNTAESFLPLSLWYATPLSFQKLHGWYWNYTTLLENSAVGFRPYWVRYALSFQKPRNTLNSFSFQCVVVEPFLCIRFCSVFFRNFMHRRGNHKHPEVDSAKLHRSTTLSVIPAPVPPAPPVLPTSTHTHKRGFEGRKLQRQKGRRERW